MRWSLAPIILLTCRPLFAQDAGPTPDQALKLLKEGNARFVRDMPKEAELGSKRRIELAQGQKPIAVILTCSDSRAAPEIIFDKRLGMLFVIRVAGNVTGPEVYGSIEYALAVLKTPLVVVLGHTKCGAVEAALKAEDQPSNNLKQLISLIHPGKDLPKDKKAALKAAIRNNVLSQTGLLTKKSEIIRDFATSGRVRIVPAVYDLSTGEVNWLEASKK
ncbi:MAG TPA: carbonic anhydrase [Gemmataceae bacterium]|nr:carbonic anhydrase [Gemmataceae bacterium]